MQYVVAVRTLCEFTAKQGDLDLRFTPSPTALQGIAGHHAVTGRRGASYESEVSLESQCGALRVRGRADGYDSARHRLEEIKTHRGDLARQPANHRLLHWAQLKVYGALLCRARGLAQIELALVYFDIGSQVETVLSEAHGAQELQAFFENLCGRFLAWAEQEMAHRRDRDAALMQLSFPHQGFRPGQRELAEAVYRSAASGRCLMAQAPTGIGKTVATLFPLLKACPTQALDKLFFLAAKTPGRRLALDVLAHIAAGASAQAAPLQSPQGRLPLRVLELTARDKACEHPDKACHGDACPLARGFYDRLPAARTAALALPHMDQPALRSLAREHAVCPYYLAQEMVRWADVVVGDYNYYFDSSALLHAMTAAGEWRVGVLVDEAHNLVERGRKMYSAELMQAQLRAVRRSAAAVLKRPLARLQRAWKEGVAGQDEAYAAREEIPGGFLTALQQASAAIADHLAEAPAIADGPLQQFYFSLLGFTRLAESFGEHSLFDVTLAPRAAGREADATLCIRNLIPAPFLAPRIAGARSVALFSATLSPTAFYQDTLGLPANSAWIDVASPFAPEQLSVQVVRSISTRLRDRQDSAGPIAGLVARQFTRQPGNYLAFFSSFDYLQMVWEAFRAGYPQIACWEQSRRMAESERGEFLARFTPGGAGIGFAVLGGSFSEGIDLPGDRLVGAFIATLGLPQVNPVNERMKARMEAAFGAGYDYTYLYPGLQKVVQAAGRVIRTREDKGTVVLIDDRFGRPAVRNLLPGWWRIEGETSGREPPPVL